MADILSVMDIKNIEDGVVIVKGGGMRSVLLASTINFALKSQEEQTAITSQYQNFLNSVDFPLQIVCSSRKIDISPYLESLNAKRQQQPSELLRIQLSEYVNFIKSLTELANIMSQTFYVIIPFAPVESYKKKGVAASLGSFFEKSGPATQTEQEMKTQLAQRVEFIMSGLAQIGIMAIPLKREELINLYYHSFNPEAQENIISTPFDKK